MKWPTTLHCDLGCDNYDSVPWEQGCFVPEEEIALAKSQHRWWQNMLGPHYRGFFDANNSPKANFKKIMHLKTWAHLGLSKELKHLHPTVHVHIISRLLDKHPNLHRRHKLGRPGQAALHELSQGPES